MIIPIRGGPRSLLPRASGVSRNTTGHRYKNNHLLCHVLAPHVVYKTDKTPDEPCSITSSLAYFPDEDPNDGNVTGPPRVPPSNLTVVTVEGCPSFVILDWEKSDNETRGKWVTFLSGLAFQCKVNFNNTLSVPSHAVIFHEVSGKELMEPKQLTNSNKQDPLTH